MGLVHFETNMAVPDTQFREPCYKQARRHYDMAHHVPGEEGGFWKRRAAASMFIKQQETAANEGSWSPLLGQETKRVEDLAY
jgi:hypothetical protein